MAEEENLPPAEGVAAYPPPDDQQYMPPEMGAPEVQQYMPAEGDYQQPLPPDQQYMTPDQQYMPPDQQYMAPDQQYMPPDQQYMPQDHQGQYDVDYGATVPPEQYSDAPPDFGAFFFGPGDGEAGEGEEEEEEGEEEEPPKKPPFPTPQYVEPKMPPDMRICDKYFVKPGQWGVTPSGTLVPGTGMRPPNVPIPGGLQDDSLTGLLGLSVEPKGASQMSFFKGIVDTCSIDTRDKVDDEEDVSEEELMFESFDSEYLKTHLGIPLTLALAEIVAKKPTDPIHYLGHWLFKWHYNQEARAVEKEKVAELIQEREQMIAAEMEKKRLEEEKIAQLVEEIVTEVPEMVVDPFEFQMKEEEYGEEALGEEVSGETASEEAEQAYYADPNYYA